jgi:hypothetical protein
LNGIGSIEVCNGDEAPPTTMDRGAHDARLWRSAFVDRSGRPMVTF